MNIDFVELTEYVCERARCKWISRKNKVAFDGERNWKNKRKEKIKVFYPTEIQVFLNLTVSLCNVCGKPCSADHLTSVHKLYRITSKYPDLEIPDGDQKFLTTSKTSGFGLFFSRSF